MKFHRKLLLLTLTIIFFINLVWDLLLHLSADKTTPWNYWYNLINVSSYFIGGVTAVIYGIKFSLKSNIGKMLFFFGLGILSFTFGGLIWLYYNLNLDIEVPFPSLADAAYVPSYILMAAGTFFLARIYQSLVNKMLVIGSIIVASISFVVIFGFFSSPDLSSNVPLLQKVFYIYYPAADVVTITLAFIALILGRGNLNKSLYLLSLGLLIHASADVLLNYLIAKGSYWNGGFSDLLFSIAGYYIGVSLIEIIFNLKQPVVELEKPNEIS